MTEQLDIEKFNPTVAELTALVEVTKKIKAKDLTDKKQLEVVKRARIDLKNARIRIEKAGKELRADAVKFQKAVIAKEDELVGIIGPEEERLKSIEAEAEQLAIMQVRQAQLPERKERLMKVGIADEPVGDEFLLAMDSVQFETYYNEQVATKNEKDRQELQRQQDEENAKRKAENDAKDAELRAREAKIAEDQRKLDEEARAQEREARAREDERMRLQREEDERKGREARAKEESDRKEAEDKAKLERAKKYQKFLADNGYTKENDGEFKQENTGSEVVLWKKVAVFKI